jgi:hypothetical protein
MNKNLNQTIMKKRCPFFVLFMILFMTLSSSGRRTLFQTYSSPISITATDSSSYGVTYSYDAAGNRISRQPNTVILSALLSTGVSQMFSSVALPDSVWGNALTVSPAANYRLSLSVSQQLNFEDGIVMIYSHSKPSSAIYIRDLSVGEQALKFDSLPGGLYAMNISIDGVNSRWSVILNK